MRKRLIIAFCLGILLVTLGTGLFVWYAATRLARGGFLFGISEELLANPPIAAEPGIADRIDLGIEPLSLLDLEPAGTSNAAAYYVEVVRSMAAREMAETAEQATANVLVLTEEELETFLQGARQARCDFSTETLVLNGKLVRLAPAVDFSDSLAHISWFRKVASAVIERGAEYEAEGMPEMAVTCYESTVKFGHDIEKGRESLLQVFMGAAVQKMGAEKLKNFYENAGDAAKAGQWEDFLGNLETFTLRMKDKTDRLTKTARLGPESIANQLWILEHDEDHLFRREAIAGLGVARAFALDIVDPALERVTRNDPDPYVREAARNALDLFDPSGESD